MEEKRLNLYDDDLMVSLGIRLPLVQPRDKNVWTKTASEKAILAIERNKFRGRTHFNTPPIKNIPVRAKLIIQLKKNKKFPNTTYSTECWQHEIGDILSKYCQVNKSGFSENLVLKYTYNGQTYKPNERPFWN